MQVPKAPAFVVTGYTPQEPGVLNVVSLLPNRHGAWDMALEEEDRDKVVTHVFQYYRLHPKQVRVRVPYVRLILEKQSPTKQGVL